MKLFTSLTASAAFAQAQDFPGFGGSLADLLAQLNIENQLDLGIGATAGNDANVNGTEGEFDPVTGERYLIANNPDPTTPFTNNCDPNSPLANTTAEKCNPCVFDPSVCNGSPQSCSATQDGSADGIPRGINDNGTPGDTSDDWWEYICDCTNHVDEEHKTDSVSDTWAGPDCQCPRCEPYDTSLNPPSGDVAACLKEDPATDPCLVLASDSVNYPNIDADYSEPGNTETCSEIPGTNDYTCPCNDGFYGFDCNSEYPCGSSSDGVPTSVCNMGEGDNVDVGGLGETCDCGDCSTVPDNQNISQNMWGGPNCNETICQRDPPASCVNGSEYNDHSGATAQCTCVCDINYSGADCSTDDCSSTTCLNGGTPDFRSVQGQCNCNCPTGFTGARCETATNTPTGTGCWKCDAMTYVQCATEGSFQTCSEDQSNGDNGVCFVEYREQNQKLTQLCTGCKDAKSCDNLKRQNFVPGFEAGNTAPFMRMRNQCKPDYRLQVARRRYGNTQSVCRQCFSMCSNADAESAKTCFGGLGNKDVFTGAATDADKIGAAQWIRYYKTIVGGPASSSSPWNGRDGGSTDKLLRNGDIENNEAIVLGIPLHVAAGHTNSQNVVNSPLNHIFRGYTKQALSDLIDNTFQDGNYVVGNNDDSNPLYWALADSTDFFWSNDLIRDQGVYAAADDSDDVFSSNGYDPTEPCELDYGAGQYCDRS